MRTNLPSRVWRIAAVAIAFAGVQGIAFAQEEEPENEPLEELVFVDAHFDGVAGVDGLDGSYDIALSPDGAFLYVASMNDDAISIFSRNASTGELAYVTRVKNGEGSVEGLNGSRSLEVSPDGEFLYAVGMFDDSLVSFSRDPSSGGLTYLGRILDDEFGVDGLDGARSLAISPDGMNLYVAGWDDNALALFSRDPTTGEVGFLGRHKHGEDEIYALDAPHHLTVSPDGKNVYVALWDEDALSIYDRDLDTGLLTFNSKLANGAPDGAGTTVDGLQGPRAAVVSADGKQLYVVAWNGDSLTTFNRTESGALEFVAVHENGVNGVEGLDGAHSLALSSDGKFVYVAAFFDDAITVFARDPDVGTLAYDQTIYHTDEGVEGLNGSLTIMASPDGEHVYSSSTSEKSLVSFRRELIIDPPVFTVEPVSKSVPSNSAVSFNALAEGIGVAYQWRANGVPISGATDPVFSIDPVVFGLDQTVYSVEAYNAGGSVVSADAVLTVLPEVTLETPETLTAVTLSSDTAVLNWIDQSNNETGFAIQRKISGGEFETIAQIFADNEEYTDSELDPGTEYIYRIRATRTGEVSEWSNEAVIESFDRAPNTPANLFVTLEEYNRVGLQWSDRSAVEDGYLIERQDQSGGPFVTVGNTLTSITVFLDRTVAADSSYVYRVRAYNESGGSDYSNSVVAQTLENPVTSITPLTRSVPSVSTSDNLVLVTGSRDWEAIPNVDWLILQEPVSGAGTGNEPVSYRVMENLSAEQRTGEINIGGLIHTVVQEGAELFVQAIPADQSIPQAGGDFSFSIVSNTTWDVSSTVAWLQVTSESSGAGNGSVTFSATENTSGSQRAGVILAGSASHTVYQSAGNTSQDPPAPPEGGGSDGERSDGILITWEDNSDFELGFIIERTERDQDNWAEIARVPANTTSYLDRTAEPGVAYSYRVSAYNENGVSDPVYIDSDGLVVRSRIVNLSTRGFVGTGHEILIAGFGIRGTDPMKIMTRSVGPKLGDLQVSNTLGNPVMSVRKQPGGEEVVRNDDWSESISEEILTGYEDGTGAFSIATSSKESVVVRDYDPGLYTALLSDADGGTGVAMIELYRIDEADSGNAELINISTRGYVGTGDSVMIGGFVILGDAEMNLLIRGVGQGLVAQGVDTPIADPFLSLYSGSEVIAENDDWEDDRAAEKAAAFTASGAFMLEEGSGDAAMLVTLGTGLYTVVLDGASGETGIGLFEIYVLD